MPAADDSPVRCPTCQQPAAIGVAAGLVIWECRRGHRLVTDTAVLAPDCRPNVVGLPGGEEQGRLRSDEDDLYETHRREGGKLMTQNTDSISLAELDEIVDGPSPAPKQSPHEEFDWAPNSPIYFDIETGPESEELLQSLFDYGPESIKSREMLEATFDESTVRYGNTKDEAKRVAKLEEAQKKFDDAKAAAKVSAATDRQETWEKFVEKAPLDPIAGRILTIGYGQNEAVTVDAIGKDRNESQLLKEFWVTYRHAAKYGCTLVGFNIAEFDIPFIIRRSWKYGITTPTDLFYQRRYLSTIFVDLLQVWRAGRYHDYCKLDRVAEYLGTARKTGEGAHFHKLFFGSTEEQDEAVEYARQDIRVTREVALRLLG